MTERNKSILLDGGEEMGMTDAQYKGMLLDQLKSWKRILEMVKSAGNTEVQIEMEKEIELIEEKLKF